MRSKNTVGLKKYSFVKLENKSGIRRGGGKAEEKIISLFRTILRE